MDEYYLVNVRSPLRPSLTPLAEQEPDLPSALSRTKVVHNAFKEKEAIFAPFEGLGEADDGVVGTSSTTTTNGKPVANGIKA